MAYEGTKSFCIVEWDGIGLCVSQLCYQ